MSNKYSVCHWDRGGWSLSSHRALLISLSLLFISAVVFDVCFVLLVYFLFCLFVLFCAREELTSCLKYSNYKKLITTTLATARVVSV